MTNTLAQDLGGVVRLLEKATPGPWVKANSYRGIHTEHPSPGPVHVCRAPEHFHDQWELNAPAIEACVNFLRAHSAEIAGALRDAERWRVWRELGEHEAADIAWLNAGEERDSALDAMQQGGG